MNKTYTFNALAAGLNLSSKFPGLFFETQTKGDIEWTTYYNQNGKTHNMHGSAIVKRISGEIVQQTFMIEGNVIDDHINTLVANNALVLKTDEHGAYYFDETDVFTIQLALNS